ncbi:MAG TPA: type II secretion system F family protein [Gallionella sp.]|nr:type II secretion system F family protein [Gallionella sp.]
MQYEVRVLRGNAGLMSVMLEATDVNDARAQATAQGYTFIAAKAIRQWLPSRSWQKGGFPLVLFSQELVALLDAGLSLVEALEALNEKEERPEIRKTLTRIISLLYEGHPLSYALEQSPDDFPALYVATVRASERTGSLAEVLSRYIVYQTQMDGVRRKIVTSSIYPVILAVVGGTVILFLMLFVVPRFSHIYEDLGHDLPLMSRLMMLWGHFLDEHWKSFTAVVAMLFAGLVFAAAQPACREWAVKKLWEIPVLGRRLHLYQTSRFYRSLGMLLRGGMPIMPALQLVGGLLQASVRERLTLASTRIREGAPISRAMDEYGLATPLASRLLLVGERTGRMGEMMERIAAFYEDETARWVERFIKMFEPLLMAFVGLVIGLVVVLMYFPIFELAGSIE